jgi:hypothetical protein
MQDIICVGHNIDGTKKTINKIGTYIMSQKKQNKMCFKEYVGRLMNSKSRGTKWSWLIQDTISACHWRDREKRR